MIVDGKAVRPIWLDDGEITVKVIDQRQLPHEFAVADLTTVDDVIFAIREMFVRGAPLIGVTGAYGVMIAAINGQVAAFIDGQGWKARYPDLRFVLVARLQPRIARASVPVHTPEGRRARAAARVDRLRIAAASPIGTCQCSGGAHMTASTSRRSSSGRKSL